MKKWFCQLMLYLLWLAPLMGYSFTFSITPTNETCAGNASLHFTTTNADPNGTILYVVYKLPNLTTPYTSLNGTTVNGLAAGDYRVIARETVGNTTTTQQQDITISSSYTPLSFSIQTLNQACSTTSTISVEVSTGTAATYEVFSGPITFAPQNSNTFTGLPVGVYKIRVIDSCGNAVVQTFTVTLHPTSITVAPPVFADTNPFSCSSIVASNTITPATGTVIGYPLHVHYLLHLPGAASPTNVFITLTTGDPLSQVLTQTIPYYPNQVYGYDIILTDACGTTYPPVSFDVSNPVSLSSTIVDLACNQYYFTLGAANYSGSYTLQFTASPAGFTPTAFNSTYPGPFNQAATDFGSTPNPVPFGHYEVSLTDSCGKTTTTLFDIISHPPIPVVTATNNGCLTHNGKVIVTIPRYKIVTAVITVAPAAYPFSLPHEVTASVDANGILTLDPLAIGDYTIVLTDDCGDLIPPLAVTVPDYVDAGLKLTLLKSCDLGKGAVKISSNNGNLTAVSVTAAPAGYPFSLPQDVSNTIVSSGSAYLGNLPAGTYTFTATDACGFTNTKTVVVEGYAITNSTFSLVAHCGSFDIPLDFVSNTTTDETFWLQKLLDPVANIWGNPISGAPYTEGTVPNGTNSYELQNNTTNFNLTFNGTFRILHHFNSYNSGSDVNANIVNSITKNCIEILSPTLTFTNALAINDVYRVPCSNTGNLDVLLFTNGAAPLHYHIIEKDGQPFLLDNGTSNIFLNIAPGIYKFEVEDSCGNTINRTFDVSDLVSLVTLYPTCDLFACATTITGAESFNLAAESASILGPQSPLEYTLTYHTSLADAQNNTNPIDTTTPFVPTTNPQTIYIRLIFNQLPSCFQTGSFAVQTGQTPAIHLDANYQVCDSQPIVLDASSGNSASTTYAWSTGATTPTLTVSQSGITTVSVTATNTYGSCLAVPFTCPLTQGITVDIVTTPQIDHIVVQDWTDTENSITVYTTHNGDFEYSIDGFTYQDNPQFAHLAPGVYTVHVRDKKGCQNITQELWLLNYPKFFTPNDDGYHDKWFIKNSEHEPHFQVEIYDRYGKLITGFTSAQEGWDGTLKGNQLFADDYWFVVHREDGRIYKGHFALLR